MGKTKVIEAMHKISCARSAAAERSSLPAVQFSKNSTVQVRDASTYLVSHLPDAAPQ